MINTIVIPTGFLIVDDYSKGRLETLSIGDYGKSKNIKANFLGYYDNINGVPNGKCMPLTDKWVITLSTQYGCAPMKCKFCDCPNVPFKGNATVEDLEQQLATAIAHSPDIHYTDRLNIHFARMGEPSVNKHVFTFARNLIERKESWLQDDLKLRTEVIHPVLTTSLPRNYGKLKERIMEWCDIKNVLYRGQAGFQFSINSTSEAQRDDMFSDKQLHLEDFAKIADAMPNPVSRKYCLNFALASGYEVDGERLASLFDPEKFMVKITPIHNNNACRENGIETEGGYWSYTPYAEAEQCLIEAGFDVLVFVPSQDEEDGLVTCGNAVLGGSTSDKVKYTAV